MEKKTRNILLIVVLVLLAIAVTTIVLVKGSMNKTGKMVADTFMQDTLENNIIISEMAGDTSAQANILEKEIESNIITENSKPDSQQFDIEPQASDPISKAIALGRPVLIDFGRGTCIPCKKMMPILAELKKEYSGKVEVLVLDLDDYYDLAREYEVQMIPTQIFFDTSGKEVTRHVGFMGKAEIVAQLQSMSVTGGVTGTGVD